jgi:hypothetical protein
MVAVATWKIDGMFYMFGLFIGFFIFNSTVERFWSFFNNSGFLGRVTLFDWLRIPAGVVVFAVVLMALFMFWGAEKLEKIFSARRSSLG